MTLNRSKKQKQYAFTAFSYPEKQILNVKTLLCFLGFSSPRPLTNGTQCSTFYSHLSHMNNSVVITRQITCKLIAFELCLNKLIKRTSGNKSV